MIGEDKLIHFSGVEMGEACTIILRGASEDPTNPAAQGQCLPAKLADCLADHVAFIFTCRMLFGFFSFDAPTLCSALDPAIWSNSSVDWPVFTRAEPVKQGGECW